MLRARRGNRKIVSFKRSAYKVAMTQRQRKFAGTLMTVGFLVVYSLIAMAIGGQYVVGHHGSLEFAYFVLAGIAWLPVIMMIIRWMSKPDFPSGNIEPAEPVQQGEGNA
jgi:Protein of unknown function (DUF2842)